MATKVKAKTPAAKLAAGAETKAKPGNVFTEVASQVENLTEKQAFTQVEQLVSDIESNSFRLGGILAVIQDKGWLGEYADFKTLVQDRFGIHYRKAAYLINIYNNLVEKQIPWSAVKDLGWTKLKELAPILTQKNVEGWVKKAEKMTVLQLIEAVAKAKGGTSTDGKETVSGVTTKTFKLHKDQRKAVDTAIDKGKKEFETDSDSVALANICSGYNGGTVTVETDKKEMNEKQKKKLLSDLMAEFGWEETFKIIDKLFDKEIDVSVSPK